MDDNVKVIPVTFSNDEKEINFIKSSGEYIKQRVLYCWYYESNYDGIKVDFESLMFHTLDDNKVYDTSIQFDNEIPSNILLIINDVLKKSNVIPKLYLVSHYKDNYIITAYVNRHGSFRKQLLNKFKKIIKNNYKIYLDELYFI